MIYISYNYIAYIYCQNVYELTNVKIDVDEHIYDFHKGIELATAQKEKVKLMHLRWQV